MNEFIASDEIISATHLQLQITLHMNMFISSNEQALCWRETFLALETNAFGARDEWVELEMNTLRDRYSHSNLPLKRSYPIEEIQRYVNAQQRLRLH